MTGAVVVNNPHTFQRIRDLFVGKYLNPQMGTLLNHNMKLAWHTLDVCRSTLDIDHGETMFSKQLHAKMWDKYMSWTKIIRDEDDCGLKINDNP